MEASDYKITKLKRRRDREVVKLPKEKTNNDKLLRALRKKMKSIVSLQDKQSRGEDLDAQQLEKLGLYDETKLNLNRLEQMMAK